MPAKPFIFICGSDDFLVDRLGREQFARLAAGVTDEFSREILNGFANNVGEVESAVNRFRDSVQTIAMFGDRRVVWLRDVNFLADSVTGRAAGTLQAVADLQALLERIDPAETGVLITAAPVDRRRSFPKFCEKTADFTLVGADDAEAALSDVVAAESRTLGVTFTPDAVRLLLGKVGVNTRLLVEEVRKLANYVQSEPGEATVEESDVAELTPNVAEGDFFETAEAFFRGDLSWTLAALQRHFFAGGDARPVIAALQNRNRLLIQVRTLLDAGEVRLGRRGLDGLSRAGDRMAGKYGDASGIKSSFNVFRQNPWYLGKLSGQARLPSLRRLIDNQREFITAFEEIVRRPHEQEEVLRDLAVRCLSEV